MTLLGVFFASIVYVTIRLSFLLVAVTVDEKRIDLIRAWELTHRNFWRALWVSLFVGTPVWLLYVGIQFAFVGFAAMVEATGVSPMTFQIAGLSQSVAARMHFMLAWLPYLYAAWFLVRPLGSRALVRRGRGGVSRPCARRPGSVHSAGGPAHSGRDRLGFRTR